MPVVNVNQAYLKSKFATFIPPDRVQPKEIFPTFTATLDYDIKPSNANASSVVTDAEKNESVLDDEKRRQRIDEELEKFLNM